MRTPIEQAIYLAERPFYDACARTEKAIALLASLRALIKPRLPLAEAEAEMDDIEGHLDVIGRKLAAALVIQDANIEGLQVAEDARYNAANDDAAPLREAA